VKFQIYHRFFNFMEQPHPAAVFDKELQGWTVEVDDLAHLTSLIGDSCAVLFNSKPDLPVIELRDGLEENEDE